MADRACWCLRAADESVGRVTGWKSRLRWRNQARREICAQQLSSVSLLCILPLRWQAALRRLSCAGCCSLTQTHSSPCRPFSHLKAHLTTSTTSPSPVLSLLPSAGPFLLG